MRRKLEKFCSNINRVSLIPVNPDNYVTNLSPVVLSANEEDTLSVLIFLSLNANSDKRQI